MANVKDWRGLGASTGVSLSTTAARTAFIPGTDLLSITPRNLSTAVVARFNFCPWAYVFKTADLLATAPTDYTAEAQDGVAATVVTLSGLDTLANGDAVYVGSAVPFRGLAATVASANGTAATIAVTYWDGNSWENITPTDGTASGGATFAVTGNITWTVPADWAGTSLKAAVTTANKNIGVYNEHLYWVRIAVSAAMDASTTLSSLLALNASTTYAEIVSGQTLEQAIHRGLGGQSAIEALTDAGTGNLLVRAGTFSRFP